MSEHITVEPLGGHDYLVRVRYSAGEVESRFRASEDVLERLGAAAADERRVIEETAAYLVEQQPVIDLPPLVDLDDMVAAFDGFLPDLRLRIGS